MKRLVRAAAAAAVLFGLGFAYARFWWGPGPEALERQRREVQRLGEQLDERLRERARLRDSAGENVVVGIPAGVAERLAGEAMAGLVPGIGLTLHDLRFRKADEVRARLLLGRRTVGRFVLSVHVREMRAVLRPRKARLRFDDGRVAISLPVSVEDGEGRARLRFKWDGRGVAGAVCGDLDVTREVTATVPRRTYTLEGGLRLSVQGTALVAQPEFGDVPLQGADRALPRGVARRGRRDREPQCAVPSGAGAGSTSTGRSAACSIAASASPFPAASSSARCGCPSRWSARCRWAAASCGSTRVRRTCPSGRPASGTESRSRWGRRALYNRSTNPGGEHGEVAGSRPGDPAGGGRRLRTCWC